MCGIAGLFLKDSALDPALGSLLAGMLGSLCDRGPDSAGFAVYGEAIPGRSKLTLRAPHGFDFAQFLRNLDPAVSLHQTCDTHVVITVPSDREAAVISAIAKTPAVRIVGGGKRMAIFKEVGRPDRVATRFGLDRMAGTHAIGHTRMATESAVNANGAHPFTTGPDQCLVHNGSLSNHNAVRRDLIRQRPGISDRERYRGRRGFSHLEDARRHFAARGDGSLARGARRLLHFCHRHRIRLRRAARSDRLQASGDGRNRPLGSVRHRISRAGRSAGDRRGQGLGAGAGARRIGGNAIDARRSISLSTPLRELNARAAPACKPDTNETHWRVLNPARPARSRGGHRRADPHRDRGTRRLLLCGNEQARHRDRSTAMPAPGVGREHDVRPCSREGRCLAGRGRHRLRRARWSSTATPRRAAAFR